MHIHLRLCKFRTSHGTICCLVNLILRFIYCLYFLRIKYVKVSWQVAGNFTNVRVKSTTTATPFHPVPSFSKSIILFVTFWFYFRMKLYSQMKVQYCQLFLQQQHQASEKKNHVHAKPVRISGMFILIILQYYVPYFNVESRRKMLLDT